MAFDICDGRNKYAPCPACGRDHGMGLTSRRGYAFIACACGHEGPGVAVETPSAETDEAAFNAWNQAARG